MALDSTIEPLATPSLLQPVCCVAVATFIYLGIDAYLATRSARATMQSLPFYALAAVHVALGILAYGMVQVAAGDRLLAFVGHGQIAEILKVVLAVGAATTVLQSFTLKISDYKIVDFGQLIDRLRVHVYEEIVVTILENQKRKDHALADCLSRKFADFPEQLRDELNSVLRLDGEETEEIVARLDEVEIHARRTGTSVVRGYAIAIVTVDQDRAKNLTKRSLVAT